MAKEQDKNFRYIVAARHEHRNEPVVLDSPLRIPIFTTSKQATTFRKALEKIRDKSLPIKLMTLRKKWPWKKMQDNLVDASPVLLNPSESECKRAIFTAKGFARFS